jgi:serine/threonine protein kinase
MAPEVLRCEAVTEAADCYSYGVVLWEVLTGLSPWENYNPMQARWARAGVEAGTPAHGAGGSACALPGSWRGCAPCLADDAAQYPDPGGLHHPCRGPRLSASWATSMPACRALPPATPS